MLRTGVRHRKQRFCTGCTYPTHLAVGCRRRLWMSISVLWTIEGLIGSHEPCAYPNRSSSGSLAGEQRSECDTLERVLREHRARLGQRSAVRAHRPLAIRRSNFLSFLYPPYGIVDFLWSPPKSRHRPGRFQLRRYVLARRHRRPLARDFRDYGIIDSLTPEMRELDSAVLKFIELTREAARSATR